MNTRNIAAALLLAVTSTASAQTKGVEAPAKQVGNNIIAISPVQISENGVAGIGISYEHMLDKGGIVSGYLPVMMVMNTNSEQRLGTGVHKNDPMYYIMPGVKIYPTGSHGLFRYAIGPSLVYATGERTDWNYTSSSSSSSIKTSEHSLFGIELNQSVNICPTPHLYLASEFGFGFTYLNRLDGINQTTGALVQFAFKVGYRF